MLTIDVHDQIYNWSCAVASNLLACCFMSKLCVLTSYLFYCCLSLVHVKVLSYIAKVYIILNLDSEIQDICDIVTHKIIEK